MTPGFKKVLMRAADFFGAQRLSRWHYRQSLVVLCYHGVVQQSFEHNRELFKNTVSADEFRLHIGFIAKNYTPLSGSGLLEILSGDGRMPPRSILITFDDGYRNNLTIAAPILREFGVPAIFHVSTGFIGEEGMLTSDEIFLRTLAWKGGDIQWPAAGTAQPVPSESGLKLRLALDIKEACKRIPDGERLQYLSYLRAHADGCAGYNSEAHDFMNWDEVRRLANLGFEIGSHTVSHPILTRCSPAQVQSELETSRKQIEAQTGTRCRFLAYPNGSADDFSPAIMASAEHCGYAAAFSVQGKRAGSSFPKYAIPRLSVAGHLPVEFFEAQVSGLSALLGR